MEISDPRIAFDLDRRWALPDTTQWTRSQWSPHIIAAIIDAKEQYPTVFMVEVTTPKTYNHNGDDFLFIVRPLSRREFNIVGSVNAAGMFFDREVLYRRSLLWPDEDFLDDLPAGVIETVYDTVEMISGWGDVRTLQELQAISREQIGVDNDVGSVESKLDMTLGTVFKSLSPLDIKDMDAYESMHLISMVEGILSEQGFKFDLSFEDRKAEEEIRRKRFVVNR